MGHRYTVREDGPNGSVEVRQDEIIRIYNNGFGRDDTMRIPMRTVTSVDHDRQLGGDVVTVRAIDAVYTWKLADGDAENLSNEITSYSSR